MSSIIFKFVLTFEIVMIIALVALLVAWFYDID